jgi:hypothetical protein
MDTEAVAECDGDEPTVELQRNVNGDLQCILEYGESHPDEYGGRWLLVDAI